MEPNTIIPTRRFEIIYIDYVANLLRTINGNTSFLLAIDLFSGNPIIFPVRQLDFGAIVNFLEEIFVMFDVPRMIISDRSIHFNSQRYFDYLQRYNIEAMTNIGGYYNDNLAERRIRQVRQTILSLSRNNEEWDQNIQNLINRALSSQ